MVNKHTCEDHRCLASNRVLKVYRRNRRYLDIQERVFGDRIDHREAAVLAQETETDGNKASANRRHPDVERYEGK